MINKTHILGLILVPIVSICDDAALLADYKNFQEQYFQKSLELSKLGAMIVQQNILLSSFSEEATNLINHSAANKIIELEEKNGKPLSEEEKKQVVVAIKKWADDFLYEFFEKCEKNENIEGVLMKGLLKQGDISDQFEALRFYLIRSTFERSLRMQLIQKYEDCIKEMSGLYTAMKRLITENENSLKDIQ